MSPLVGQTVSHYKILEHLGGGGMGVVYKAQDLRLDRPVALKFLPPELTRDPEARERFVHEARAASALDHQNICVVHDIAETADGQSFIVMAYYEGETLKKKVHRGPMKLGESVDLARQVAQGLAKAHEHGIVHRDIKPANIMVSSDGMAKIVDFGLAKLSGRTMLTKVGSTLGTAGYMSPEQARGEIADHRTDIWSLGVVLFEMLTGACPFAAEYEQASIFKILNDVPAPITRPDLPKALGKIVDKAMAKDPAARYSRAEDMAEDLRAVQESLAHPAPVSEKHRIPQPALIAGLVLLAVAAAGLWFVLRPRATVENRKSIALLPITSITKSESDQEFADGLHDHLLTQLTGIRDLTVISRQSVLQYKGTHKRSKEIADELGVQMLVEASVQHVAGHLRMQVQLIDGPSEAHLWANTYDRQLTDIFAVQSELAQSIVNAMRATMTPEEKSALEKSWTKNREALELYLRGVNLWDVSYTREGNMRAAEYFDKASDLDPQFAAAFAMAAYVHAVIHDNKEWDPSPSRLAKAETALRRAQALDPTLPETHIAAGVYASSVNNDFRGAERELEAALASRPNSHDATNELALIKVRTRQLEEAQKLFERAEILDPRAVTGGMDSRCVAWARHNYEAARILSDRYLARFPDDPMSYCYHAMLLMNGFGDRESALETVQRGQRYGASHSWTESRSAEGAAKVLSAVEAILVYLGRDYTKASALMLKCWEALGDRNIPLHVLWICRKEKGIAAIVDSIVVRAERRIANDSTSRAWPTLAIAYASQGRLAEARVALQHAESIRPSFDDPWLNDEMYPERLATAYVILGEKKKAMDLLEDLLSRPSWLTVWKLRSDPLYDPLRNDLRFKRLLSEYGNVSQYAVLAFARRRPRPMMRTSEERRQYTEEAACLACSIARRRTVCCR